MTDFQNSYAQQKQAYYSVMNEARQATPDKQPELVQQLLDMNSAMASEVRDFIANDPESDLKPELAKIQKEFMKIQQASDRKKTLEMILNEDQNKIKTVQWQYQILLVLLGLCIIIIIYMIIRHAGQTVLSSVTPTSSIATS